MARCSNWFLTERVVHFFIEGTKSENVENIGATFEVDLTKISPMIKENVSEDVVVAAKTIIEAFI